MNRQDAKDGKKAIATEMPHRAREALFFLAFVLAILASWRFNLSLAPNARRRPASASLG
jgi:hypothetical protein